MFLDEILQKRQSVRAFKQGVIDESDIKKIALAAQAGPSAKNEQGWRVVAVTDPEIKENMVDACRGQVFLRAAAAILVVYHTSSRIMSGGQRVATVDGAIAMTHMMIKATELGYGSCWLGAYANDTVKELLKLPEEAEVISVMPIGFAAETPPKKPRKPLNEILTIK